MERQQLLDLKARHLQNSLDQIEKVKKDIKAISKNIKEFYNKFFPDRKNILEKVLYRKQTFINIIDNKKDKLRQLTSRSKYGKRPSKKLALRGRLLFEKVHTQLRMYRHILLLLFAHRRFIDDNWQIPCSSDEYSSDEYDYYNMDD